MSAAAPKELYPTLIFHVDVNSAFLSWSALKELSLHPGSVDLRTIPSAVAGDVETRHGIITAKSIPAKAYGIQTAEPVASALAKCPSLVLIESDFATYKMYSRELMTVLRRYSDAVEQVSIDEAYLDMGHLWDVQNAPAEELLLRPLRIARQLREEVKEQLGFTVNVGISVNKLLAKTASDFKKPDYTHTLWPEEVPEKLWPMPVGELHGCGHASAEKLQKLGIFTVGDAARTDIRVLQSVLGDKASSYIRNSANGIGSVTVHGEPEEAKSYSNETTTSEDIGPEDFDAKAVPILRHLSEKVAKRLQRDGFYGQSVTVSVKTSDFRRRSKQLTLDDSTNRADVITDAALTLARSLLFDAGGPFPGGQKIRLIGVGVSKLDHGEYRQMTLFDLAAGTGLKEKGDESADPRRQKLDAMMARIRDRYGEDAIRRGGM